MIRNLMVTAYRQLKKNLSYSLINLLGLSVGMAIFMLISLFVSNELKYDRYHEQADRIYRVMGGNPEDKESFAGTPAPLGPLYVLNFPDVVQYVRLTQSSGMMRYGDRQYREDRIFFADPSLFAVFSFPLVRGDQETALPDKDAVVITESMAEKYFGEEDPIGKVLLCNGETALRVTAVAKDVPEHSHFHFDFVLQFERLENLDNWGMWNYHTYLLLSEHVDPKELKKKFDLWAERDEELGFIKNMHYQPLTQIHFQYNRYNIEPAFNSQVIRVFTTAAFVVLILACANFINLSTARASRRAREVGVKKSLGANRPLLVFQFLGESTLIAFLAMVIALILTDLSLPAFNGFIGRELHIPFADPQSVIFFLSLLFLTGGLSGLYPAFLLSSFQAADVIKGRIQKCGGGSLRNFLVVLQFAISITLIISMLVIAEQMHFVQSKDIGMEPDVVTLRLDRNVRSRGTTVKQEMLQIPGVVGASLNEYVPSDMNWNQSVHWPGQPEDVNLNMWILGADADFFETMKIRLFEGTVLQTESTGDRYVLNRSAVEAVGWNTAAGQEFSIFSGQGRMGRIMAVTEDFHFRSLHHAVEPCVILIRNRWSQLSLRLEKGRTEEVLEAVKKRWNEVTNEAPFDYYFLDDDLDTLYREETKLGQLLVLFSGLSLMIGCLGLFSLASFAASQRTKEIGVRKVLGASVPGLVSLLVREFTVWVILANLLACPAAFWLMTEWLKHFEYRVSINPVTFILAALGIWLLAMLTVSNQAINAARMNPVKSLRYE